MMWYLYGIVSGSERSDLGKIGFVNSYGEQASVVTIPHKGVALVASELDEWRLDESNKQDLMQKLIAHQKTLEEVMKRQLVIPIKFGTVVDDIRDINMILERGSSIFNTALADMEGRFEVNLTASWDLPAQLKKIAEEDEDIKAMKAKAEEIKTQEAIMQVGMKLEDKLEERRKKVSADILASLNGWGDNRVDHERLENKMILNCSFLIAKDRGEDFLTTVHNLDTKFGGEYNFKCMMPLPPHSFRTVVIKKIDPDDLREAMKLFEIDKDTTLDALKEKGRELTQRYHPDARQTEDNQEKFSKIHQTFDLLKAFYTIDKRPFADMDIDRCFLTRVVEAGV